MTLYGESPWRVVYTSAAVMVGCAVVYPLVGSIEFVADGGGFSGPNWLKPLYFSVVTFTTLGCGDVRPKGEAAQLLSMGESLIGAALIALLVAVLSRRITR